METDATLPNKLRLIVKSDKTSPTVTLLGNIRTRRRCRRRRGKTASPMCSTSCSRTAPTSSIARVPRGPGRHCRKESRATTSRESAKTDFARGVELLADNLLHPALPRTRSTSQAADPEYLEGQIKVRATRRIAR